MNILVTGGNGFIGSHVVDKLAEENHNVTTFDLAEPYKQPLNHINGDILDFNKLKEATKNIDVIYHLAAVSNVNKAYKDPIKCINLNSTGTINILEAARVNNIKRVIFASTVWVYAGSKEENVDEKSPFHMPGAGHIYTSTKIAGELFCHDYKELYDQDFTILRYGIPYGPRARETTVIPIFVRKAINKEPLTINGSGKQYRNFIYVEDLAEGNVLALNELAKNKIYNLDGTEPISIKQVAETIKSNMGDVEIIHKEAREGDYKGKTVSSEKAKIDLNWQPKTTFLEGMKKYINWYKNTK